MENSIRVVVPDDTKAVAMNVKINEYSEAAYYKHQKEELVTGYSGSDRAEVFLICAFLPVCILQYILTYFNKLATLLHQVTVTFLRQRWDLFNIIRINKNNKWLLHIVNMNIDFVLTLTPIFLSITFADYNKETYASILLFIVVLIVVSENDKKGKIVVNFFKHVNPRPSY